MLQKLCQFLFEFNLLMHEVLFVVYVRLSEQLIPTFGLSF